MWGDVGTVDAHARHDLAQRVPSGSCPCLGVEMRGTAWPLPHHVACVWRSSPSYRLVPLRGVFILAAIVLHQTPAQAWPRFLYRFQTAVLAAIYACRIVWWAPIAAASLRLGYLGFPPLLAPYVARGFGSEPRLLSPCFLTVLLLVAFYTYFNADTVQYNRKLLRKAGERVQLANEAEERMLRQAGDRRRPATEEERTPYSC